MNGLFQIGQGQIRTALVQQGTAALANSLGIIRIEAQGLVQFGQGFIGFALAQKGISQGEMEGRLLGRHFHGLVRQAGSHMPIKVSTSVAK